MTSKQNIEKSPQKDRLRSAVDFLLNCFGPMHHLKMGKIVCFVLKDVGAHLLEMDDAPRMETFCTIPSIVMDDLGFLEKKESSKLDSGVVSKEELLLLFVVCYLSLNGKSHCDKVVKDLRISSPLTINNVSTFDCKAVRRNYLEKYSQFFRLDDEECLELDGAFHLPIKRSSNGMDSSKTEGFLESADSTASPQPCRKGNLVSEVSNIVKPNGKKMYCSNTEIDKKSSSAPKLSNESEKKMSKKSTSSPKKRKKRRSSLDAKANVASKDSESFEQKIVAHDKVFEETAFKPESHKTTVNIPLQDIICLIVREGIVFLYERFKCRIDMHLVLVILHVLDEAKNSFLSLIQSEQIALVKNIISPRWIADVEDNSGTCLNPSLEAPKLSKEQKDLLLISYAVGQSEKLRFSTLLKMFEKHRLDATELMKRNEYFKGDLFSINEGDCVKFENFPPVKWMAERLFRENNVADKQDISVRKIIMKRMFTKDLSKLPRNWLDNLVLIVQESIAYLLQFFEFNLYSGLFEIVMNAAKDCVLFFDQTIEQQRRITLAIFRVFHIDARGRVFSNNLAMFRPIENNWKILLCMLYLVNLKRIVHYRELFASFHARMGHSKYLSDHKQKNYFKSRQQNFFISSDGYVSLINVLTIKFSYISMLLSERNLGPMPFNPGFPNPRAVVRQYFGPPVLYPNAFMPLNVFAPRMNFQPQVFNPMVMMPKIEIRHVLNNNVYNGHSSQNAEPASENQTVLKNEASEISNSLMQNAGYSSAQNEREETTDWVITDRVWERVKVAIFYLSQRFTLDADDFFFIFCVLEDANTYVRKLSFQARDKFVEECLAYYFSCSSISGSNTVAVSESSTLDDEEKVALFAALLLNRVKELHFEKICELFFQSSTADVPCGRSVSHSIPFEFGARWKRVFSVGLDGKVKLLPILVSNDSRVPANVDRNGTMNEDRNANCGDINIGSNGTKLSDDRNENFQVSKTASLGDTEDNDNKVINEITAPVFNLLEVLNDDESSEVCVKTGEAAASLSKDHCVKDSIKELRTRNFFVVVLGQSKEGVDVQVLKEKLRLASVEVQHYITCVYKDNILHFFQNRDDFFISPTTGNVCYQAKNQ